MLIQVKDALIRILGVISVMDLFAGHVCEIALLNFNFDVD